MHVKNTIRKLLGDSFVENLKTYRDSISVLVSLFVVKSKLLSIIYYTFINRKFSDEIYAVVAGRVAYTRSLKVVKESSALLRRNTHRIEKGLVMEPRRPLFATGFVGETIDCLEHAVKAGCLDQDELKWILDVHDAYFEVVLDDVKIRAARNKYTDINNYLCEQRSEEVMYKPFSKNTSNKINISFDDLSDLMSNRHSVRWFEDREVDIVQLQKCADIAVNAPTACNRQPYKIHVTSSREEAVEIASIAGGTNGFAHNIPCTIVVTGDLSYYPNERDRHIIYIDSSLMIMQFVLLLESVGLSTCLLNWTDIPVKEKKLRGLISLEIYERPIMMLAVGYARDGGGIPYSQKKSSTVLLEQIQKP